MEVRRYSDNLNRTLVDKINFRANRGDGVALIEVSRGCGHESNRQCRICQMHSPKYQGSMPFSRLSQIFRNLQPEHKKYVPLFRTGDPIYYQDNGHDIADVVQEAVNYGWRPAVRTHGCLPDERNAIRALKNIADLHNRNRNFSLEFSLDTFGYEGISFEEYLKAAFSSLVILDSSSPSIEVYFQRGSPTSIQTLHKIINDDRFLTLNNFRKRLRINEVLPYGRARTLFNIKGEENNEPWKGHGILFDGEVINKQKLNDPKIERMGNLFP